MEDELDVVPLGLPPAPPEVELPPGAGVGLPPAAPLDCEPPPFCAQIPSVTCITSRQLLVRALPSY